MDFPSSVHASLARIVNSRRALAAALASSLILGLGVGLIAPSANASDPAPSELAPDSTLPPSGDPTSEVTPESASIITPETTATPEASTAPSPSSGPDVTVLGAEGPRPAKYKKPKPATRERKAKNVPERPLDGKKGRRIVYDKSLMHVWIMDKDDSVVARFPIVGRWDRPVKGTYKIYSKSDRSGNPNSGVTFDHMTRFAYGNDGKTPIGFHSIPKYYDGRMMHSEDQLGLPVATGGCVRMAAEDAEFLYDWAKIGDKVVVLPSPS